MRFRGQSQEAASHAQVAHWAASLFFIAWGRMHDFENRLSWFEPEDATLQLYKVTNAMFSVLCSHNAACWWDDICVLLVSSKPLFLRERLR